MIHKYSVAAVEQLTGESPTPDVECDAYVIIGLRKDEEGEWDEVGVVAHATSKRELINAMETDKMLRSCAQITTYAVKRHNRPWRRLWRWLRGEQDEQEA